MSDTNVHPGLDVARLDWKGLNFWELGSRLYAIVQGNPGLEADFPGITQRYATPLTVTGLLWERLKQMRDSGGKFVAYIVFYGQKAIGVATVEQDELCEQSEESNPPPVAVGPWLAYWLDDQRPEAQRHLGVAMLRLIAHDIIRNSKNAAMFERPFTLVRPDNSRSLSILANPNNGFGGFVIPPASEAKLYVAPTAKTPMLLVKGNLTLDELRRAA
ncbi:MAG TPA: hypothetical protein VLG40_01435 [Candidatus Saccharimonas sp.]|nr:hypothetical protein [Candidatus Saccharimonas sp.]